eukprot:CAMPEP_0178749482 /NCGR_PEP_ID=MMETSP0744-20121128/9430_1 /TAXON_ID=913974 /ORGANISM="Nitzschia punctata, Strain CCMP561" /LENGTH=63 /DNA_ID=CAMNT_0020402891 /DNA_START=160 /DNA_END=351 /DNA_ORIENTATION=-
MTNMEATKDNLYRRHEDGENHRSSFGGRSRSCRLSPLGLFVSLMTLETELARRGSVSLGDLLE